MVGLSFGLFAVLFEPIEYHRFSYLWEVVELHILRDALFDGSIYPWWLAYLHEPVVIVVEYSQLFCQGLQASQVSFAYNPIVVGIIKYKGHEIEVQSRHHLQPLGEKCERLNIHNHRDFQEVYNTVGLFVVSLQVLCQAFLG